MSDIETELTLLRAGHEQTQNEVKICADALARIGRIANQALVNIGASQTVTLQHDETGRMIEWPISNPIPHGYSRIIDRETLLPDLLQALQDAEFLLRKVAINWKEAGAMVDSCKRSSEDARAALNKATK